MKKNTFKYRDGRCNTLKERKLVEEMNVCDATMKDHDSKYNCYRKVTKESRKDDSCLRS